MFDPHRLSAAVERFKGKTVLVVGDLIADEYIYGKPSRISREAPVLILRFSSREVRLGGAANASPNVHGLGARVIPVGVGGGRTRPARRCSPSAGRGGCRRTRSCGPASVPRP